MYPSPIDLRFTDHCLRSNKHAFILFWYYQFIIQYLDDEVHMNEYYGLYFKME